jgi:hypothetical protein
MDCVETQNETFSKLDGALRFELTNATKTCTDDEFSHDEWLSLPFVLSFLGFSRF